MKGSCQTLDMLYCHLLMTRNFYDKLQRLAFFQMCSLDGGMGTQLGGAEGPDEVIITIIIAIVIIIDLCLPAAFILPHTLGIHL